VLPCLIVLGVAANLGQAVVVFFEYAMVRFQQSNPSEFILLLAIGLALFGYVFMATGFGVFEAQSNAVIMRTICIAATVLLILDVVQCADIARGGQRNVKSVHFWMFAFYMGYFWFVLMVLMLWQGTEKVQSLLITWSLSGAAFGIIMAFLNVGDPAPHSKRFDLERPRTERTLGFMYYAMPLILSGMIILVVWFAPTDGRSERYVFLHIILLGSLTPLYEFREENRWRHAYPRMLGIALLLIGLLAFQ
jgi:hypothetical protein